MRMWKLQEGTFRLCIAGSQAMTLRRGGIAAGRKREKASAEALINLVTETGTVEISELFFGVESEFGDWKLCTGALEVHLKKPPLRRIHSILLLLQIQIYSTYKPTRAARLDQGKVRAEEGPGASWWGVLRARSHSGPDPYVCM